MTDPEGPGDPQPQGERDDKPELDIDTAFAAIIADFARAVPHGVGPWPASEDLDDEDDGHGEHGAAELPEGRTEADGPVAPGPAAPPEPPAGGTDGAPPVPGATLGPAPTERWRPPVRRIVVPGAGSATADGGSVDGGADDLDDDEGGYHPPEPPPLPRGDLVSVLAWGAVIGGPVFLLLAALMWRSLPTFLLLLALVAFVGGFVTLVARMPQEHPDDPDDGAVV